MNQPKTIRTRALWLTAASVMALGLSLAAPTVAHAAGDDITISTDVTTDNMAMSGGYLVVGVAGGPGNVNSGTLGGLLNGGLANGVISTGNLTVSDPVTWATNLLTLVSDGAMAINANLSTTSGSLSLQTTNAGSAINVASGVTVTTANGLTLDTAGGATVAGVIAGAGDLSIQTAGTVTLSVTNTYTGATTVQSGTLALTNAAAIVASSGIELAGAGTTLDVSAVGGFVEGLSGVAGSTVSLGGQTFGVQGTGSSTFAGNIIGTGNLNLIDGALTLTGTNTYSGNTLVQGTLTLDSPTRLTVIARVAGVCASRFFARISWSAAGLWRGPPR